MKFFKFFLQNSLYKFANEEYNNNIILKKATSPFYLFIIEQDEWRFLFAILELYLDLHCKLK